MNIGSLEVMLGVNTAGLSRAAVNMRRFESDVASFSNKLMTAGVLMTQFFTVPIALFAGASTRAFMNFEKSLGKMATLTSFTTDQIKTMAKEILKLSPQVGKSPKELAEGLYFIGSSGISDQAMAMDVLTKSANAARIGLGETKTVADALTSVLNAYGKDVITAGQATDILVAAVREGKGEASAFASVLGHIMPIAVQLGVGFDQVAGSVATLTLSGKSAAEASTQITRLFTTLIQTPPKAEKALERFGISFEILRKTLRDQGMVGFMEQLKDMIGGNTLDIAENTKAYEENMTALSDVFPNLRALLPVLDLMGPNFDNLKRVLQATGNATYALDNAVGKVSKTLKDQWQRNVADLQISLIKFGETLQGPVIAIMQKVADFVSQLADKFAALPAATQQNIIGFGLFLAVLGPLSLVLGTVVSALGSIGGLIVGTSIMSMVTQFILLGAAIYYTYKNWDMFEKAVLNFDWRGIPMDIIKSATAAIPGASQAIESVMLLNSTLVQSSIAWSKYAQGVKGGAVGLDQINEQTKEYNTLMDQMQASTTLEERAKVYEKIQQELLKLKESYKQVVQADLEANGLPAKDLATVFDQLSQQYVNAQKGVSNQNIVTSLVQMVGKTRADALTAATTVLTDLDKKANNLMKEKDIHFGDFFKKAFSDAKNDIVSGANELMQTITGIDLSKLRSGVNIGETANDMISFPVKIVPKFIMPEEDDFQKRLLSMAKAFDPTFIDSSLGLERLSLKIQNIGTDLTQNAKIANQLGKEYDKTGTNVDILNKAFDDILSTPKLIEFITPEQTETLKKYLKLLDDLQVKQQNNVKELAAWRNLFSSIGTLMNSVSQYMSESFQKVFKVITEGVNIIGQVIQVIKAINVVIDVMTKKKTIDSAVTAAGVGTTLLAAGAQGTLAAATTASAVAGTASATATAAGILPTIAAAGAQETLAIANTNAAITGAAASTAWIPIVGVGLAIAGVAAMVIMLSKNRKTATMAQGGMVPGGFPNDSFPAMLSSGETVIPLGKVAEIFGNGARNEKQQVVFEIEGRKLVGILQNMGKLQQSY